MNTIRQLCTRCIVLKSGKVIFDGDNETAIQKYNDNYISFDEFVDLSEIERGDWLGSKLRCKMLNCHVLNKNSIVRDGDILSFSLNFDCNENIDKLHLRIEFNQLGEAVTSSFSKVPIKCTGGNNYTATFDLFVDGLLPGTYETVMVLYEYGENGSSYDCDCVRGFSFVRESNEYLKNNWNYYRWGKIENPEAVVKEISENNSVQC